MIIRVIDDSELVEFMELFIAYNSHLASKHNKYNSSIILLEKLKLPGSIPLGLFKEDKLVGFVIGNDLDNSIFHFTDMYITPKYRFYTKKLLIAAEGYIKGQYRAWVCEAHTKEGINLFSHFGAKVIEIKYYKEI